MKVALHNLGCKVNAYETDAMRRLFFEAGYEIVPFQEKADIYIVNTCSVTNIADRKSRQMLHRAKKTNPDALVAAVGCYPQTAGESLELDDSVDVIVGNNRKNDIVRIVEDYLRDKKGALSVTDIAKTSVYEDFGTCAVTEHTRAIVKIQDGCDMFCSYCVIPYARGRIRSRSPESVLEEIKNLAEMGFSEVVLTGIHLSSYHADGLHLIDIVERINETDGIYRIRLGSLEPGIITENFLRRISRCEKVCPHFHLSLQSGCDDTLRRMNRRYTTRMYAEKCGMIRDYYKDPAFTTDVIVGFPGETDEEFKTTKAFAGQIGFADMHIFKYSKRQGTPAADMPDQVAESIKTARSEEMIALAESLKSKYRDRFIGGEVSVLFEESEEINGQRFYVGHSAEYIRVAVSGDRDIRGQIFPATVQCRLNGEIMLATL